MLSKLHLMHLLLLLVVSIAVLLITEKCANYINYLFKKLQSYALENPSQFSHLHGSKAAISQLKTDIHNVRERYVDFFLKAHLILEKFVFLASNDSLVSRSVL